MAAATRHGAANVRVFGGRPVDVVTEPGLQARIRQRVLAEAVPV